MNFYWIVAAAVVLLFYILAFSMCRISGECSRNEEAAEAKNKPCPVCKGVCGIETAPNDWHDCDECDATGKVLT